MADLNEQSTTEEVSEFVEQLVADVQSERAAEKPADGKGDAQITSEHANNEHKIKMDLVGTEDRMSGNLDVMGKLPPVEKKSDKEDTGRSWIDDDLKAEVAAYGIQESELNDFASREELDRALRLFDKSAMEAGRKVLAAGDGQARNEQGQFAPKAEPDKPKEQAKGYQVQLNKDLYDEQIVEEFGRMRDHYEARLETLESRFHEADAKAEEQHFDGLVDSLDHADLFGKTGKEDAKQLQRRQDLHIAVKAQQIGLSQLGRPTELNDSLVNRVARMVFADELGKKDLRNRTRKISKQSNGRQGGGATRPQDPREDPRDEADRLYKAMERG